MQPAVVVEGLSKQYSRHHANRPFTLHEAIVTGWRNMGRTEKIWALQDVSFTVLPGEMLGVIGNNGAGKSTLLTLIGGIIKPDRGTVQVNGRIGALLDLGAGFHPELTGRENAHICGVVCGLTRTEVARRMNEIVQFAELESAIDSPFRTYSSGMKMRLGFSVVVHTRPDVLLIDECLAVGDRSFQAKCLERIETLRTNGCAVVLISHSVEEVREFCNQVLCLQQGKVLAYGDPQDVVGLHAADDLATASSYSTRRAVRAGSFG